MWRDGESEWNWTFYTSFKFIWQSCRCACVCVCRWVGVWCELCQKFTLNLIRSELSFSTPLHSVFIAGLVGASLLCSCNAYNNNNQSIAALDFVGKLNHNNTQEVSDSDYDYHAFYERGSISFSTCLDSMQFKWPGTPHIGNAQKVMHQLVPNKNKRKPPRDRTKYVSIAKATADLRSSFRLVRKLMGKSREKPTASTCAAPR